MNHFNGTKTLPGYINENDALIIYFYNDDCAPCVQLRPKIQDLITGDFPLMELLFVETKKFPEFIPEYSIFSSPVIIAFFGGKEFYRWSKYISTDQLKTELQRPYKIMFG